MAKKEISSIIDASFLYEQEQKVVPVSPAVDLALSGKVGMGIREGTWTLLSGIPKSGKSTTALQIAANAQELYGKQVFIGNVEFRLKKRDMQGIRNFDVDKAKLVQSSKGNIMSSEDHVNEYVNILKNNPGCVLIVDSTSALCEQGSLDERLTPSRRSTNPRLMSEFCKTLCQIVPIQDSIVILIQHVLANTGQDAKFKPFFEGGGNKIQFQADYKMLTLSFKLESSTENGAAYGQYIKWKVFSSALGPPGAKFQSFLRYGYGLDNEMELINIATDCAILNKGGAGWYTLWNGDKVQGQEKLRAYFMERPEEYQTLIKMVEEVL